MDDSSLWRAIGDLDIQTFYMKSYSLIRSVMTAPSLFSCRSELRQLKQMNAELMARSERLSQQHSDMEIQCIEHGKLHKRMKARLHQMEEQNNKNAKQVDNPYNVSSAESQKGASTVQRCSVES